MTKTASSPQRKLAAIMFTDIAGYTAAMSADEESALKTLRKKRSILKPLIIDNNGTFVKEIGDGTLSYFHSAIDAATCAVSLQQATYEDADMNLRIGVHVGDIVFDDEDVFGDGVNVAARLESMAPIGGVCVSKSVFEELLNKKEFDGVPLGLQQLKGVGRLIDVFALKAKNLIHPDPKEYEEHKVEPHSGDEVPSVAVLPLKNKGKEEDAFYAYGITADLVSDLSRAGRIRVVSMDDIETADVLKLSSKDAAKKLNVRYIVNGMLWKHADMFQLSIEMDDTQNNTVIWSDRWQEQWDELKTIKTKLTDSLLTVLNLGENGLTTKTPTNTEAYEYYLKGTYKFDKRQNLEDVLIARGFYEKAIELDDKLIRAKYSLGYSYVASDPEKAMGIYKSALKQAESINDMHGIADLLRGIGWVYGIRDDTVKALDFLTRSLEISQEINDSRNVGAALGSIGVIYFDGNEHDKAMDYYTRSYEIFKEIGDKGAMAVALRLLGSICREKGDYEQSLEHLHQSLKLAKELGEKSRIGESLYSLGVTYSFTGDEHRALECYHLALETAEQLENKETVGMLRAMMTDSYVQTGEYEKAFESNSRALEIYEQLENSFTIGIMQSSIGQLYQMQGQYKQGLEYSLSLLETAEKLEDELRISLLQGCVGGAYFNIENYAKAVEYLEKATEIQKRIERKTEYTLVSDLALLFLSYKQLGSSFDPQELLPLIKGVKNIDYDLNYNLYELLNEDIYLEAAYKQVQKIANGLEDSRKFLNYPKPKAIVDAWESIRG